MYQTPYIFFIFTIKNHIKIHILFSCFGIQMSNCSSENCLKYASNLVKGAAILKKQLSSLATRARRLEKSTHSQSSNSAYAREFKITNASLA